MKHVGLGWEDKDGFLAFVESRKAGGLSGAGGRAAGVSGRKSVAGKGRGGR